MHELGPAMTWGNWHSGKCRLELSRKWRQPVISDSFQPFLLVQPFLWFFNHFFGSSHFFSLPTISLGSIISVVFQPFLWFFNHFFGLPTISLGFDHLFGFSTLYLIASLWVKVSFVILRRRVPSLGINPKIPEARFCVALVNPNPQI
jgi:hypothetical protein